MDRDPLGPASWRPTGGAARPPPFTATGPAAPSATRSRPAGGPARTLAKSPGHGRARRCNNTRRDLNPVVGRQPRLSRTALPLSPSRFNLVQYLRPAESRQRECRSRHWSRSRACRRSRRRLGPPPGRDSAGRARARGKAFAGGSESAAAASACTAAPSPRRRRAQSRVVRVAAAAAGRVCHEGKEKRREETRSKALSWTRADSDTRSN